MPDERNYHIFYRLLAGLDKEEKNSLHLTVAEDYHYLSQGNCFTCDGMDDEKEFANIRRAMKVITSEYYWHHKRELNTNDPRIGEREETDGRAWSRWCWFESICYGRSCAPKPSALSAQVDTQYGLLF